METGAFVLSLLGAGRYGWVGNLGYADDVHECLCRTRDYIVSASTGLSISGGRVESSALASPLTLTR